MTTRRTLGALVLVLTALAACADQTSSTPDVPAPTVAASSAAAGSPAPGTEGTPSATRPAVETRNNRASLTRAASTAKTRVPTSTVVQVGQDAASGTQVWVVRLITRQGDERKVVTSADGSRIVIGPGTAASDATVRQQNLALAGAAEISYLRALEQLPLSVTGGAVTRLELVRGDTQVVWQADASSVNGVAHAITVDATTGRVLADRS